MNRLDCLDDALIALAVLLHDHGPACVCLPCTAYAASKALLPRLAHVLAILQAWERGENEPPAGYVERLKGGRSGWSA